MAQCVRNEDIAWHAGWWDTNTHSIGIEHAGYIDNPDWFTKSMYHSSAKLSAWCCKEYEIPIDRKHIIGHDEVPGCSPAPAAGSIAIPILAPTGTGRSTCASSTTIGVFSSPIRGSLQALR